MLSANSDSRDSLSELISNNNSAIKAALAQQNNLSNRLDGLAKSRKTSDADLRSELDDLKGKFTKQNAELTLLRNEQNLHAKAINSQLTSTNCTRLAPTAQITSNTLTTEKPNCVRSVNQSQSTAQTLSHNQNLAPDLNLNQNPNHNQSIAQSALNIIVEGLGEDPNEDLPLKFSLLCESIGVNVQPADILDANRIQRRNPIKGRPNPSRITLHDLSVKDRIMGQKANLQHREDLRGIWINHDEPAFIRRAKGRARHIASFARKKGFTVQMIAKGIIIENTFYAFDNLDAIPSIYIPPLSLTIPGPTPLVHQTNGVNSVGSSVDPSVHILTPVQKHQSAGMAPTRFPRPPPSIPVSKPSLNPDQPPVTAHRPGTAPSLPPPTWQSRPINPSQTTWPRNSPIEPFHTAPLSDSNPAHTKSPKGARPKKQPVIEKMRETKSGLVYSGPTARFSHLYKVEIVIDGRPFNSVEQKLQFEKATLAREPKIAEEIMNESCTWKIKNLGDRIPLFPEWISARGPCAAKANAAKFNQHRFLMDALLATGNKRLIEGTTSSFWGGGARYESIAYDLGDTHGKNHQGLILEDVRENEFRALRLARNQ